MIIQINSLDSQRIFEAIWIEVKTPNGGLVILEGHAPIITSLQPDKPITIMLTSGKNELIHIQKQALLEVTKHTVTIIL